MPAPDRPNRPGSAGRHTGGHRQRYLTSEWERTKEYWRWLFGGRSVGWWVGGVVGFVVFVIVTARLGADLRRLTIIPVLGGGAAGNWLWMRIQDSLARDQSRDVIAYCILATGIVLFVVNILPEYRENFFGAGGGYYWTTRNSIFAGIGAAVGFIGFTMHNSSST